VFIKQSFVGGQKQGNIVTGNAVDDFRKLFSGQRFTSGEPDFIYSHGYKNRTQTIDFFDSKQIFYRHKNGIRWHAITATQITPVGN